MSISTQRTAVLVSVLRMDLTLSNKFNWTLCMEEIARQKVPPLLWTVQYAALDFFDKLLCSGADVNIAHRGNTPLVQAAAMGSCGPATRLLSSPSLDLKQHKQGRKALWKGIWENCPDIVEALLRNSDVDANFFYIYKEKPTAPLTHAVTKHYSRIVEILLADRRTDPNLQLKNTPPPLISAMSVGADCLARYLMSNARFEVITCCCCGGNSLHHAAETGRLSVLKTLLSDFDIDVNAEDTYGSTALIYAAAGGHEPLVQELLSHRVNMNSRDHRGNSALWYATNNGHEWVARRLLYQSDIQVNTVGEDRSTSLHHAVVLGSASLVNLLLARQDIDPNMSDDRGRTPLWWAVYNGNQRIVECLLQDPRVKIDVLDRWQQGPLEVAGKYGHDYIWFRLRVSMIDVRLLCIPCTVIISFSIT